MKKWPERYGLVYILTIFQEHLRVLRVPFEHLQQDSRAPSVDPNGLHASEQRTNLICMTNCHTHIVFELALRSKGINEALRYLDLAAYAFYQELSKSKYSRAHIEAPAIIDPLLFRDCSANYNRRTPSYADRCGTPHHCKKLYLAQLRICQLKLRV